MTVITEPISEDDDLTVMAVPLTDYDNDDDDCQKEEDIDSLPTVNLWSMDELFLSSKNNKINHADDNTMMIPLQDHDCLPVEITMAVAEPVASVHASTNELLQGEKKRAEYISATFHKSTADISLGFKLHRSTPTIASIYESGLADESPLAIGDTILSINNRAVNGMSSSSICKYLWQLVGKVTILVHNEGGSPDIVESMVTKSNSSEMVGIGMKGGPNLLKLTSIDADKVSGESILNVGDQILSINGVSCERMEGAAEAANLIKLSPKCVTIVAKTLSETGIVIAEIPPSPSLFFNNSNNTSTNNAFNNNNSKPTITTKIKNWHRTASSRLGNGNDPALAAAAAAAASLDPRNWQLRSGMNLFGGLPNRSSSFTATSSSSSSSSPPPSSSSSPQRSSPRGGNINNNRRSNTTTSSSNNNARSCYPRVRLNMQAWEMEVEI